MKKQITNTQAVYLGFLISIVIIGTVIMILFPFNAVFLGVGIILLICIFQLVWMFFMHRHTSRRSISERKLEIEIRDISIARNEDK